MSTSSFLNKSQLSNRLTLLVAGLQKHLASGSLVVGNTTYASSQLETSFNSLIAAIQATATAKAAYQAAVKDEEELAAQVMPLAAGVRSALYVMYKGAIATLADFGIAPHKAPSISPAERVAAAAKAKATRAARHTMSKKQKLAITGSPVVASESTAPEPAASPAAPGGTAATHP